MEKRSRFIEMCKRYKIIYFFIAAVVLAALTPVLGYGLAYYLNVHLSSPIKFSVSIYRFFVGLVLAAIWISIFTYSMRYMCYKDKTGRNYFKDSHMYKRSFRELLDYFKDADTHAQNVSQFKEESWKDSEGIMLGKAGKRLIKLPSDAEGNVFVAGAPGSRKTTGIAIPTCARYGGSVLAVDIKGDIYNFCHKERDILRFCPDLRNERGESVAVEYSCHFNPFDGISDMNETDKKLYLSNMALMLIPDNNGSDGNYFASRARNMFLGIIYYLLEKKPGITLPEALHVILHGERPEGLNMERIPADIFQWVTTIAKSDCRIAKEQISSLYGNNEKNVSGAYDQMISALTPFSNDILDELLNGKEPCISVKSLESGKDVYLQISQENLDVYAPLFTMIISAFMSAFTKRPDTSTGVKNRPILILMDEFPQLTFNYSTINSALSTLRSKSVQCVIIAQNVAQLSNKYRNDGWRALLGNCSHQAVLKTNEEMTQKYFASLFGTTKVLKLSSSSEVSKDFKSSRSVQETREPIFQPEDFGDMENEIYIYFNGKRIKGEKLFCHE